MSHLARRICALAIALSPLLLPTTANADGPSGGIPLSCKPTPHVQRSHAILTKAYDERRFIDPTPITHKELRAFRTHRDCTPVPTQLALRDYRQRKSQRYRADLHELVPFTGGGTRWAIPYPIVACESGGSWSAYNPSGALGPYQLLGHGAPFPVRSNADKLAHHQIAHDLYADGAGRGAWVC